MVYSTSMEVACAVAVTILALGAFMFWAFVRQARELARRSGTPTVITHRTSIDVADPVAGQPAAARLVDQDDGRQAA